MRKWWILILTNDCLSVSHGITVEALDRDAAILTAGMTLAKKPGLDPDSKWLVGRCMEVGP